MNSGSSLEQYTAHDEVQQIAQHFLLQCECMVFVTASGINTAHLLVLCRMSNMQIGSTLQRTLQSSPFKKLLNTKKEQEQEVKVNKLNSSCKINLSEYHLIDYAHVTCYYCGNGL